MRYYKDTDTMKAKPERIYVNDGTVNRYVPICEVDGFIKNGFQIGYDYDLDNVTNKYPDALAGIGVLNPELR